MFRRKRKMELAIDLPPCQNFLLELKIAAIKNLDYEEFVSFLGLRPSTHRLKILRQLNASLSLQARNYWEKNFDLVFKGVLFQGRWEKYFRNLARIVNF